MRLGKAFSDSLVVEQKQEFRRSREGDSWWLGTGRALIFATILCIAFFILVWRLFDLTVIRGHEYRALADGNRTRELVQHAPRGNLLDRTGKPLTENIPKERTFVRRYLFSDVMSQITGYTGELNEQELADEYYALRQYRPGDRIGRAGAEAVYEEKLRGRDGKELVEVDAGGNILRTLGVQPFLAGTDITLSVDAVLAQVAARAFPPGEKGAIVVSKPSTGEILALYSSPSFDANVFSPGMSAGQYQALIEDPARPMFNRAIAGVYPPGSTFKIVMGLAGLEEGVLKPDTTVTDAGTITIGPFSFSNWYFNQYGKVEGVVDTVKAFQRSNDIFFYKVGEWLGITKIAKWAHIAGIGKILGIELSGEATGLVPDPAWKSTQFRSAADLAARNDQWYLGDTYHVSIGQGYLLTTPLQVNTWTNIIANGGRLCRPTIAKVQGGRGDCRDLGIKKETIKLISTGMQEACSSGGTGWPLFDFGIRKDGNGIASSSGTFKKIPVACKTGTAEYGDPQNKTHAWFTVFAPVPDEDVDPDNKKGPTLTGQPEISITVLVEGAGEGSNVAAPVAKKILEEWFSR